jgi:hypothetical protein
MSMIMWFVLMIAVSTVWLVWFLKNPLKSNLFNLEKSNVELGKQRQAELEQDLRQNLIDESEFNQAKQEITQTLAIELNQTTGADTLAQKKYSVVVNWLNGCLFSCCIFRYLSIVNT